MSSIKGTQTEQNLLKSFAGEAQARNRYNLFASKAKKDGYVLIQRVFDLTAEQERLHAKRFFSFLEGGCVEITASYPAGIVGDTTDNLKAAAGGEHEEWAELYPGFAAVAAEEGFPKVASAYRAVINAEKYHEQRYLALLEDLNSGSMFEKDTEVDWYCMKCGYIHHGKNAPQTCPACLHGQGYFTAGAVEFI